MMISEALTKTAAAIAREIAARRAPVNEGFVFNSAENMGAGQIGRVVSIDGNWITVEYPCWYTRKDGGLDFYTVRDDWRASAVVALARRHYASYDAALWTAWNERAEA